MEAERKKRCLAINAKEENRRFAMVVEKDHRFQEFISSMLSNPTPSIAEDPIKNWSALVMEKLQFSKYYDKMDAITI